MAELPSGTVTFLFTDIEGSTRLLHALGQHRYDELLTTHHEILEAAFTAHEGRIADTQGDSFFVAFRTASDAVASAVDAQRDLAAQDWPEGAEVKVRMGLHTGEPKVGQERYVGIGVHRAARIGAAGHGGQVLLSWTTKGLAEEDLPPGVAIRDLGERRLKDFEQPQRLYQLVIEGLDSEFAPLKTLDVELARKRRRMYAGAALIGVLAAAVAIPVFAFGQGGGSSGSPRVDGNAVAEIDPGSNKVVAQVPNVGARPGPIASGSGSLWVGNLDDQTVARIDPSTRSVVRTVPVQDPPTGIAASPGAVWVVGSNVGSRSVTVRRIDPQFASVSSRTSIGNVVPGGPGFVAARGRTVWVAPSSGLLSRLDAADARVLDRIDPNSGPAAIALGADAVWVADRDANTVTRIDPTGVLTPIPVGRGPSGIAVGAGGVWVTDALDDAVVRIDPVTRAPTTTIPVGRAPAGIAVGDGSVWVANSGDGTVTRIDPSNPGATTTIPVGGSPQGVAVAGGRVWVTVARQTIAAQPGRSSGGVARADAQIDVDSMDPALAFSPQSWQLLYATCAKLLNYPDKPAPEGSQLIPEVARSLPARSADGKSYTFTIRKGFRFSPPSNQRVTARTFKYSIERSLSPKMKSPAQGFFGDIVGAKPYMAGKAAHIDGIVARGHTLTINLVAPAPDLVTRLAALPFVCSVPIGTPLDPNGVRAVPSAGPYYVSSYTPGQGVVLTRNPNYRGNRPHRLERVEVTVNVAAKKTDSAIEAGSVDYGQTGVDPGDATRIAARYGPGSPAARTGRQQYFVNPTLGIDYIIVNSHRPLFRDPRVRRAANFAIDRRALAEIGPQGSGPEQPTDQYLPSTMPGFKDAHVYPFTPALATARRLARGRGGTAVLYTCNQSPCDRLAQTIKTNLAAIGIDVQVRTFSSAALIARLGRPGEPFDLAVGPFVAWAADYPDPDDFLNFLVGSGAGGVVPDFTDPGYQRKTRAAARLAGPPRYLTYGKLDADVSLEYAPWIPLANLVQHDFFSARMGCHVYNPIYGMDLAALCIKH